MTENAMVIEKKNIEAEHFQEGAESNVSSGGVFQKTRELTAEVITEETHDESSCDEFKYPELKFKQKHVYELFKRILDIVLSIAALIVLAIPMMVVAILIRCEDGGPAIFRQKRVGKNGKTFLIYKFRSMCENAEDMKSSLLEKNEADGPLFKMTDDPRTTKIGSFIRRTSIDELPQLFNIIKGEMSIVGPRPLVTDEVDRMNDLQRERHVVKPGLTCFWQIRGRSNLDFNELITFDFKYINERSFWTDMVIILKTFPAVISRDGAY